MGLLVPPEAGSVGWSHSSLGRWAEPGNPSRAFLTKPGRRPSQEAQCIISRNQIRNGGPGLTRKQLFVCQAPSKPEGGAGGAQNSYQRGSHPEPSARASNSSGGPSRHWVAPVMLPAPRCHTGPWHGLGVTGEAEPQGGSIHLGSGSGAGVPAPEAGPSPSVLTQGILSRGRTLSAHADPHPEGTVGGRRPGWGRWLALQPSSSLSKARLCPGWSPQLRPGLLGQAAGSVPGAVGELALASPGCQGRPLMGSPCQLPGPSHCQTAAKGRDHPSPVRDPAGPSGLPGPDSTLAALPAQR